MNDGVVLLHGLARAARSMRPLAKFLERHGYKTLTLDYPSRRMRLAELADHIHPNVLAFQQNITGKLHLIGYSMGGLLIRAYLARYKPEHLGRVVMLATPNKGSAHADRLQKIRLAAKFYGPALGELITEQNAVSCLLKPVDYELGIVAGSSRMEFIGNWLLGEAGDGTVAISSTKLDGMADHRVITGNHTFFPTNRRAWQLALTFLQNGRF